VILREHYLVPRKILQKDFACDIEISKKHLSRMINGHVRIDASLATRIAKALSTTTAFWINLQAAVDTWDDEQAEAN
jgi:addiction module HigA family antidote